MRDVKAGFVFPYSVRTEPAGCVTEQIKRREGWARRGATKNPAAGAGFS